MSNPSEPTHIIVQRAPHDPKAYRALSIASWSLIILTCGLAFVPLLGFASWMFAIPVFLASFIMAIIILTRGGTAQGILLWLTSMFFGPLTVAIAPFVSSVLGISGVVAAAGVTAASAPQEPRTRNSPLAAISPTIAAPEASPIFTPAAQPTYAAATPAPAPTESIPVATADRLLRAAATDYITAGNAPTIEAEMATYAATVDYYGRGPKTSDQIRADLTHERHRWPSQHYQVSGFVHTEYDPDKDVGSALVRFSYEVSNSQRHKNGHGESLIVFRSVSKDPKVISVKEQKKQ